MLTCECCTKSWPSKYLTKLILVQIINIYYSDVKGYSTNFCLHTEKYMFHDINECCLLIKIYLVI